MFVKVFATVTSDFERCRVVTAAVKADLTLETFAAMLDPSLDKTVAWRQRRFDVLYKGDDWRGTEKGRRLEQQLATVGAQVQYLPYTVHTSSTVLRRHLEGA